MMEFVQLYWKRNRGWPWPEDSWGLSSMFGDDGWCHSCGVPRRPQTGALTLQRKGLAPLKGVWMPNWQFDAICLERSVAAEIPDRFNVELREVAWHGTAPGEAMQLVAPSVGDAWFDPDELRKKATARHGTPGATCPECGVWRWQRCQLASAAGTSIGIGDFNGDNLSDLTIGVPSYGDGVDQDAGGFQTLYQSQFIFRTGFD